MTCGTRAYALFSRLKSTTPLSLIVRVDPVHNCDARIHKIPYCSTTLYIARGLKLSCLVDSATLKVFDRELTKLNKLTKLSKESAVLLFLCSRNYTYLTPLSTAALDQNSLCVRVLCKRFNLNWKSKSADRRWRVGPEDGSGKEKLATFLSLAGKVWAPNY
jgi:hypothetical protein